ncbi:RrF2 family transcriptional regulator [Draconibacterium halophilum]|uniref:Rrf2 family transcriptional regulator n=1 Tax=Draconibacterium halophilum TaxID=2706887 RepID=A0A6C0RAS6_9BACT|nr:Rrf2 family transcriptional regulator [Draconibacterium halophilum]QIA06281.1 Rrf2 family transcriptional regulator [Draconibacterium halophilum]
MKFSTRTRYGLRAILEIALNGNENGIYQKDIAANQNISYKYLDQIINSLKVAGLVTKAGGRRSGYVLNCKPSEITVYDIHSAFEHGVCVVDCVSDNYKCDRKDICAPFGFWEKLNSQIVQILKSTTLEELMAEQVKLEEFVH